MMLLCGPRFGCRCLAPGPWHLSCLFFSNVGPDMLPVVDRLVSAYDAQKLRSIKKRGGAGFPRTDLRPRPGSKGERTTHLRGKLRARLLCFPPLGVTRRWRSRCRRPCGKRFGVPKPRAPATVAAAGRDFDAILQEVPRPQRLEVPVDIQPHELRAALRSMRKKAEGPELWGAEALLALAQQWWRSVLREGSPLAAWLRGKTVLLYKASGKTRPITILPFIWRCGAKLVNRQLTNWCMSWKTHHDAGGSAHYLCGPCPAAVAPCYGPG